MSELRLVKMRSQGVFPSADWAVSTPMGLVNFRRNIARPHRWMIYHYSCPDVMFSWLRRERLWELQVGSRGELVEIIRAAWERSGKQLWEESQEGKGVGDQ